MPEYKLFNWLTADDASDDYTCKNFLSADYFCSSSTQEHRKAYFKKDPLEYAVFLITQDNITEEIRIIRIKRLLALLAWMSGKCIRIVLNLIIDFVLIGSLLSPILAIIAAVLFLITFFPCIFTGLATFPWTKNTTYSDHAQLEIIEVLKGLEQKMLDTLPNLEIPNEKDGPTYPDTTFSSFG